MDALFSKNRRLTRIAAVAPLLLSFASCVKSNPNKQSGPSPSNGGHPVATLANVPGTPIALTAQRMGFPLRDGTRGAMWGFCVNGACPDPTAASGWSPGPTIRATAGTSLTVTLTNSLPVPTSMVVLGQIGGGVGAPTKMMAPVVHSGQDYTTFPGNAPQNGPGNPPAFQPPAQSARVQSFGTEVASGATADLTWSNLKPGTYLYETGTLPSLEVPMGLYGVLVVTSAANSAYPGVDYDADATLLFSEIDPVQNAAVDAAALAHADINMRFNDPACTSTAPCYPAAVNYAPTYFLINGTYFDRTAPQNSEIDIDGAKNTGNVLMRLVNAGSRTHVPAFVGLPMALVAEDGNKAPGNPKVQNEVLLTAGKTFDAVVQPTFNGSTFAPATYALFDRAGFLSTANKPDGGMQAFMLINKAGVPSGAQPGDPGMLPVAVVPHVVDDAFKVPFNATIKNNVTTNDVSVASVALVANATSGTVALAADGSFTYTPNSGFSGNDTFTYSGNNGAAGTATVTLTVAAQLTGAANAPAAGDDSYVSNIFNKLTVPRPGVLGNDSDPNRFPLTAGGVTNSTCGSVALDADGSFSVVGNGGSGCQFSYQATNSQGTQSALATVSITFGTPSNLNVAVADAKDPTISISDYRWTLQEDLTFKHDVTKTQPASVRTIGTSFHRSHMNVVATGCVGAISCGSGQSIYDPATGGRVTVSDSDALAKQTTPDQVALDPSKRYFISILPGDAGSPPGHAMGGAEVTPVGGNGNNGWAPVNVKLQASPLVPAQMSIYLYEDNAPTNGQNESEETPLGGFNVILVDPAGRTGDPAGQQTYDAFNMPLSNALLGRPGCPDELNKKTNGTRTSAEGNLVGVIYTCPNDPNEGTPQANPAKYALAGHALVKNITPARYDVIAHPGQAREAAGEVWWQVETLEGTPAQDAFTGVNEPTYFQEFGPPGPHVTVGFVNPGHVAAYAKANGLTGSHTVTGKVTNQHMSRPSDVTLYDSGSYDMLSSTTCQVVLNAQSGNGAAIAAAQCAQDGSFKLENVPAGDFSVTVFDQWLDQIIQTTAVTVPASSPTVDMGDISVLSWFTQYDQNIYMDLNNNGVYDDGEPGISNVPLTVRYRNGAPSNSTLSDSSGNGILVELFPLFNWYVAEADTTRFKQTGVHITVDGGGKPDTTGPGANLWTSKYVTGESTDRVEQPGALSYGFQGFISQRNRVDWGRTPYVQGENGGITGYVVYSSTRPFDDMRYNVQTIWEPLVPRVKVNLYRKDTLDDGTETLTLVDTTQTSSWDDFVNLVQGADGNPYILDPDGNLRDPATGTIMPGKAANTSPYPAGKQVNLQCPGQKTDDVYTKYTLGANDAQRCYDGWHNWNQVQAAPYDGRYVFPSADYVAKHPLTAAQKAKGQTLVSLPPASYVVETVTPPGYDVVKEEDKNILIGDAFVAPVTQQFGPLGSIFILPDQATLGNANPNNPSTGDPGFQSNPTTDLGDNGGSMQTQFPPCVGNLHRVPDFLSLYPGAQQVAPFAGMERPLCDRKLVALNDQMQSSATFFIYTQVPVASNDTGIILDDAASEFNAASPDFGEKASVPFVPISIKDWAGQEVSRAYSDQWGAYNMMTPSSWLVNPPTPSGYGPNMMITCMNDPGPIADPAGTIDPATGKVRMITDPQYNASYSTFCYTNPFMPGQTTYLDTPVLPIAAFASGNNPADCALADATPAIRRVDTSAGFGPWLPAAGGTVTITADGDVDVPNPAYSGPFATDGGLDTKRTIKRHYGFGGSQGNGKVTIGGVTLAVTSWSDQSITATVAAGTPTGELHITTDAGKESIDAVTVTVEGGPRYQPTRVSSGGSIQAAIDAARPGDLILVDGGVYNELVVMWKPVRLQGVGAGSVMINAAKYPNNKLETWRPTINGLFAIDPVTGNQTGTSQVDPLPTQEITGGVVVLEPSVLGSEEGAGITVLAKNLPPGDCNDFRRSTLHHRISDSNFWCGTQPPRIDGISVTGGDAGGGIYVNGWAHRLEIANNRVFGNSGAYNGGIRVGVPYLDIEALPGRGGNGRIRGLGYDRDVKIHHNLVTKNGTVEAPAGNGGAGGGISICAGSDNYSIDHNYVCGNFSTADGGGIGHLGFSQNGTIANNQILFNQSYQQTASTHGGGIVLEGEPPVAGALTLGTGDVTIDANLIRGNFAEGGQGGGIRLQQVNGAEVSGSDATRWHRVTITNNMIVNNVAGWAGAGISMGDALNTSIVNNTIASNDNSGTAGVVLTRANGGGTPSASGIVSEHTTAALLARAPGRTISQPAMFNDIIWHNRSFFYSGSSSVCVGNSLADTTGPCNTLGDQSATGECVDGAKYWDVGVIGDAAAGTTQLSATSSITSITGPDPGLVGLYCNGSRTMPEFGAVYPPLGNNIAVLNFIAASTADEANNYVSFRYGPLFTENPQTGATFGDYHLTSGSQAIDKGAAASGPVKAPDHDVDGDKRPLGAGFEIGADERP